MEQNPEEQKEQQVGFHKGALQVLVNERNEFLKTVSVIEQLMQAHIKGLKDLGVDLAAEAAAAQQAQGQPQAAQPQTTSDRPIEDILK